MFFILDNFYDLFFLLLLHAVFIITKPKFASRNGYMPRLWGRRNGRNRETYKSTYYERKRRRQKKNPLSQLHPRWYDPATKLPLSSLLVHSENTKQKGDIGNNDACGCSRTVPRYRCTQFRWIQVSNCLHFWSAAYAITHHTRRKMQHIENRDIYSDENCPPTKIVHKL